MLRLLWTGDCWHLCVTHFYIQDWERHPPTANHLHMPHSFAGHDIQFFINFVNSFVNDFQHIQYDKGVFLNPEINCYYRSANEFWNLCVNFAEKLTMQCKMWPGKFGIVRCEILCHWGCEFTRLQFCIVRMFPHQIFHTVFQLKYLFGRKFVFAVNIWNH